MSSTDLSSFSILPGGASVGGENSLTQAVREAPTQDTLHFLAGELHARTDELERAHADRTAILRLSAALLHQRNVRDLAECLLCEAARLLGSDSGSVMLLEPGDQTLEIVADIGLPPGTQRKNLVVQNSVSGIVLFVGEPLLLNGNLGNRTSTQRTLSCSMVLPIRIGDRSVGVVNVSRKVGRDFRQRDLELTSTVVATFAAALQSLRLAEQQRKQMASTIKALALAIEAKDPYTRGHCERLANYARALAERLGLSPTECDDIEMGATLHDIGKIAVPEQVLTKAGRLTPEEYEQVKTHPTRGAEIIAPVGLPKTVLDSVLHHHERMDGKGYPAGLAGEDIPMAARIIAVVDTFDAMTIARPYRGARSAEEAMAELTRCAGSQFDPRVVEAFIAYVREQGIDTHLVGIESARRAPNESTEAAAGPRLVRA